MTYPFLDLNYENVVRNKKDTILSISKFLEITIDPQSIERTLERSSFEFMKKHESKFGDQPEHWKVYNNFIRHGKIGEGKNVFSEDQLSSTPIFQKNTKSMEPFFGDISISITAVNVY